MRTLGLALTLLATGCASSAPPPPVTAPPPPSPSVVATPTPAAAVPDTLKFTATTVDGKAFDAAGLAGKTTVFWFWAAWCPKCKGDAPAVRDLQAAVKNNVNVVGVGGLGSGSDGMRLFVGDYRLSGFPQIADDQGAVWKRFEVPTQHYYVILDPAGKVVHRGPLTVDQLRKAVGA